MNYKNVKSKNNKSFKSTLICVIALILCLCSSIALMGAFSGWFVSEEEPTVNEDPIVDDKPIISDEINLLSEPITINVENKETSMTSYDFSIGLEEGTVYEIKANIDGKDVKAYGKATNIGDGAYMLMPIEEGEFVKLAEGISLICADNCAISEGESEPHPESNKCVIGISLYYAEANVVTILSISEATDYVANEPSEPVLSYELVPSEMIIQENNDGSRVYIKNIDGVIDNMLVGETYNITFEVNGETFTRIGKVTEGNGMQILMNELGNDSLTDNNNLIDIIGGTTDYVRYGHYLNVGVENEAPVEGKNAPFIITNGIYKDNPPTVINVSYRKIAD